jgi:hypothetical protein
LVIRVGFENVGTAAPEDEPGAVVGVSDDSPLDVQAPEVRAATNNKASVRGPLHMTVSFHIRIFLKFLRN